MTNDEIIRSLREYDGPDIKLMEICGSHTAAIARSGIRTLLSEKIHMISGPGCPVCVTVTAYIDRLIELSRDRKNVICTFGDLIRVPGSSESLGNAKAEGADIRMLYSPFDMLPLAEEEKDKTFIFAAVGFETTAPVYAGLLSEAEDRRIENIRLLTSLKTMPRVVEKTGNKMDGYLLPGHVCTVSGFGTYEPLAEKLSIPFVAAGFEPENILQAIYALVKLRDKGVVRNFYPSAVTRDGNELARKAVEKYFEPGDAVWRGLGKIEASGLYLRREYAGFDAGSSGLDDDHETAGCHCAKVICGEEESRGCPLFGKTCTPSSPKGACMVSGEGACFNEYNSGS